MSEDKLTYKDVLEYEHLFKMTPAFLFERFAKKNNNLVVKFKSAVESQLNSLNDTQKHKLHLILNSDIDELQSVMMQAYNKTGVKQYKILANPKYKPFIELNLNELRKLIG